LTLGLMLVSAIAVFGASAKSSINRLVDNSVTADYVLTGPDAFGVPYRVGGAVARVAGVQSTVAIYPVAVRIGAGVQYGGGVDGPLTDMAKFTVLSGTSQLTGHNLLVSQDAAAEHHWSVGSAVPARSLDGVSAPLTVTGIYRPNPLLGNWLTSGDYYRQVTPTPTLHDDVVLVRARPGTDLSALRTALEDATDPYLVVKVQNREEFKGDRAKLINQLLGILYGLLALAIVIAILGIINTLALSVVERRREIGMLRAVGMLRGQLRRTIYLESTLIALFGAVLGVGLGVTFGALFVRTLRDEGLNRIAIPFGQSALMLALAAVVGVLAALWPAARAARTRPLEAIADL
jgi:putative ABC transport system permease protein